MEGIVNSVEQAASANPGPGIGAVRFAPIARALREGLTVADQATLHLTFEGAAEYCWEMFIGRLQR